MKFILRDYLKSISFNNHWSEFICCYLGSSLVMGNYFKRANLPVIKYRVYVIKNISNDLLAWRLLERTGLAPGGKSFLKLIGIHLGRQGRMPAKPHRWPGAEYPRVTQVGTTAEGWAGFLEIMSGDTLEGPKVRAFCREILCLSQHWFYSFLPGAPGNAKWKKKKSYVLNIFLLQNLCPYFFPKDKHQGWLRYK